MISVSEAKDIVRKNIQPLTPVTIPLQHAFGFVLAKDIFASIDIPAFNQSSVDGYAFAFSDYALNKKLKIAGEVPAGSDKTFENLSNKAVRIFTGAAVPEGADTVVMQEKATVENNELLISDEHLVKGFSVRPKGAEIKAGEAALAAGTFLSPAAAGFLAGIGIAEVKVYPKPKITIIVTGKELQQPGKELLSGQVYESNSFTLKAVLQQLHISNVNVILADDNLAVLKNALQSALQTADVILLTGGISVGDYDFVLQAAEKCGVTKLFHKIKQRPGKPLYFGKKDEKIVFGLPGNPSSVLTCFYEYVIPAIELLTCRKNIIKVERLMLSEQYIKKTGLAHFLKGSHNGKTATPLDAQESYRLSSFAKANCLIYLPEDQEEFKKDDLAEVHLLPL